MGRVSQRPNIGSPKSALSLWIRTYLYTVNIAKEVKPVFLKVHTAAPAAMHFKEIHTILATQRSQP